MEPSQNTISLKMIPRIDLDRIKAKMSLVGRALTCLWSRREDGVGFWTLVSSVLQKDWFAKRKKFKRPAQRLFDAEKIRSVLLTRSFRV